MVKVSIIVPVYNVEKYIDRCINSLINQTLKDIEIIMVNDGSPDNSVDIIKKYQKKDNRIKLYEKENGGQGSARNLGLKYAKGEYIAFLDSDDYVCDNMYETLYNKGIEDELDIVICNYYLKYNDKEVVNKISSDKYLNISPSKYITLSPSPWNKIIKREYLEKCKFRFPEGIIYEDYASIPTLALNNPKIVYINSPLYYYVQSENSTMRNKEYKSKYEDIFKATEYLYNNMIDKTYNKELEYLIAYHYLYLGSLNFYEFKKYENINRIANDMKKYFPNWAKNELVIKNIDKNKRFYMKLFYKKKYFMIDIYRRFASRDGKKEEDNKK